jgi:predicted PurR-regulated permease PerM
LIAAILLLAVILVLSLIIWFLIRNHAEVRDNLTKALEKEIKERERAQHRLKKTEDEVLTLVQKVTPLIEQTDWMTGRWNGQFNTLVGLENKRNAAVVEARRSLWSIPLVANHIVSITPLSGENK